MSHSVMIDKGKCIGCGQCVKDCVGQKLELVDGHATWVSESCIYCGHCEAICPVGAVTLTGFKDQPIEFKEDTRLDPEELMMAIRTRRSVRRFKNTPVPKKAPLVIVIASNKRKVRNMEVLEIYRTVGRILRSQGASRIYLLNSKTIGDSSKFILSLEIIADQIDDYDQANRRIAEALPLIQCNLIQDDHPNYFDLYEEAKEDGIQL